ncbi:MAG: SURF1 family protein [Pseudomonadota bacterium]
MKTALAVFITLSLAVGFTWLGIWQVDRLAWKNDLIARVDARSHARPSPVPERATWVGLEPSDIEYRRVSANGEFLEHEALVKAVTRIGGGFWVIAPFQIEPGVIALVNRGFIANEARAGRRDATDTSITGLIRLSEPHGAFLRANEPGNDRWFSRDVDAIAERMGLDIKTVAPFFVDADASAALSDGSPAGGLTVVQFKNNHLVYLITWFALALMALGATVLVVMHAHGNDDEDAEEEAVQRR